MTEKNSRAGSCAAMRKRPSSRSRPFLNSARVPEDQELERRRISDPGKLARDDSHGRANGNGIEDLDHIMGSHSHTPKTTGRSDRSLLRSAVDVDAACSSVLVAWFDAFQPEDPSDNGIATASVLWNDFAAEISSLKDGSDGKVVAQLHAYTKPAKRRFIAVQSISKTESRS